MNNTIFNMNKQINESPCMFCKKRAIGCHTGCEEYENWKLEFKEAKENIEKDKMIDTYRGIKKREYAETLKKGHKSYDKFYK